MMACSPLENTRLLDEKCRRILQEDEIRFAGLINYKGILVAGGFNERIKPLMNHVDRRAMCMQLALEIEMNKGFNPSLGSIKYITSCREKVVMIGMPIDSNVLLIAAEPSVNSEKIADKIITFWYKAIWDKPENLHEELVV